MDFFVSSLNLWFVEFDWCHRSRRRARRSTVSGPMLGSFSPDPHAMLSVCYSCLCRRFRWSDRKFVSEKATICFSHNASTAWSSARHAMQRQISSPKCRGQPRCFSERHHAGNGTSCLQQSYIELLHVVTCYMQILLKIDKYIRCRSSLQRSPGMWWMRWSCEFSMCHHLNHPHRFLRDLRRTHHPGLLFRIMEIRMPQSYLLWVFKWFVYAQITFSMLFWHGGFWL